MYSQKSSQLINHIEANSVKLITQTHTAPFSLFDVRINNKPNVVTVNTQCLCSM